jgi:DNA-directed RNA polymerase subunit RPC12/RpoP
MRYYCPNCWKDFWDLDFEVCPNCGYNITDYKKKDYVDKLIKVLEHKDGEVRHWALMILAKKKVKRAIP